MNKRKYFILFALMLATNMFAQVEKIVVGENTVKINVTAEDGTVGTYVIVVNRKEKLSSDNSIKSLVIKGYELDFKSDIYQYNLQIDGEEKLDINIELNDEKAKYKIKGNNNLKNKSIIEIEVTAEDGMEEHKKAFESFIKTGNRLTDILWYFEYIDGAYSFEDFECLYVAEKIKKWCSENDFDCTEVENMK